MPYRDRDFQKLKLYKAEKETDLEEKAFDTLQELRDYVKTITTSRWWKTNSEIETVIVNSYKNTTFYRAWGNYDDVSDELIGYIILPYDGWTESAVMHMLAHIMNLVGTMQHGYSNHGIEFVKNYLALVKKFMGNNAWNKLRKSFTHNGVRSRYRRIGKDVE